MLEGGSALRWGDGGNQPGWGPGLEEAPAGRWRVGDREMNTQLSLPGQEGPQGKAQLGEMRAKSGLDESGSQEVVGSGEKLGTGVEISVVAGTLGGPYRRGNYGPGGSGVMEGEAHFELLRICQGASLYK